MIALLKSDGIAVVLEEESIPYLISPTTQSRRRSLGSRMATMETSAGHQNMAAN